MELLTSGHLIQFISQHWALVLALISIIILICINERVAQKKRDTELSTTDAIAKINHANAVVLDLRDADLFNAGHIINAICISAHDLSTQRIDKYKKKNLIIVCARGLQSAELATKLRLQGFNQVMTLAGGMSAWQEAELPLVKKKNK